MKTTYALVAGIALLLLIAMTPKAAAAPAPGKAIGAAETSQMQCETQVPKGRQIGPRDGTGGKNPPMDGRGSAEGQSGGKMQRKRQRDGNCSADNQAARSGERQRRRDGSGENCLRNQ